jgi:AcrR family transcriptional regulator
MAPPATSAAPVAADEHPDSSTGERLLAAAERLFARQGIDAVSVRAITQAAGTNIAAIHYHFGSKLDLVRALVEWRVAEVNVERAALLDALESAPSLDTRAVASAWVLPLAHMALDPSGERRDYVPFIAVLQSGGPELRGLAGEAFRPHFARFVDLLARALPEVEPEVRVLRFAMAAEATIRALADLDRTAAPWRSAGLEVDPETLVDHLVDAVAGTLAGPPDPSGDRPRRSRATGRRP